jgi:ribosomal protein S27E
LAEVAAVVFDGVLQNPVANAMGDRGNFLYIRCGTCVSYAHFLSA